MARFLVTGGAGFIGGHIVEELVNRNEEVVVIDDLSSGNLNNIKPFLDKVKFIQGSICDLDMLKKEFNGVDYVLHQAAIVSVPLSVENPILANKVNYLREYLHYYSSENRLHIGLRRSNLFMKSIT